MPGLSHSLRQHLARTRLVAAGALADSGIGERRSETKGAGLEFEDYRPYEAGDDLRRLDPYLYARFGAPFVRRYNVGQQIAVTLLLDASRSMAVGSPPKLSWAGDLAGGLAFVALANSDAIRLGVLHANRVHWHERLSGLGRASQAEAWLGAWTGAGGTDLATAVASARDRLRPHGVTFVVSDFWSDSALPALDALAAAEQAVVAVHVLSPEERRPSTYRTGPLRLVDVESGEEVVVTIGSSQIERYERLLAAWTAELRGRVLAAHGRIAHVSTDMSLDDVFLRTLPAAGILR